MTGLGQSDDFADRDELGISATCCRSRSTVRLCSPALRVALGLEATIGRRPRARRETASPADGRAESRPGVLLAEDNLVNQKVAVAMLAEAGYRVAHGAQRSRGGSRRPAGGGPAAVRRDPDGLPDARAERLPGDGCDPRRRRPRPPHSDHRAHRRSPQRGPRALPGRGDGQLPLETREQGCSARAGRRALESGTTAPSGQVSAEPAGKRGARSRCGRAPGAARRVDR